MSPVVNALLLNACIAVALAVGVALTARFVKRPSVVHALWVVVLLKLMTPPLLEVATLPRPETEIVVGTVPSWTVPSSLARTSEGTVPTSIPWLPLIWAAGAGMLGGLALFRTHRFRRHVRRASAPPAFLLREYEIAAGSLGLSTPPPLRMVRGRVPPMVWGLPGRCAILMPETLAGTLERDERIALLTHELAHVQRRDHWVRLVELATGVLFWWHPVVWWVRRNLRLSEEQACDALVVEALPCKSNAYARGLVKTLEFLSCGTTPVSGLATGAGETRRLEERLTMIVKRDVPGSTTVVQRIAIAVLALAALVVVPTWAERAEATPSEDQLQELNELRQARSTLERDLHEVDLKMHDLELALDAERAGAEVDQRLARAEHLELEGRRDEAAELRREADSLRVETNSQREFAEQELRLAQLEHELDAQRSDEALDAYKAAQLAAELERALAETEIHQRNRVAHEVQYKLQLLHRQRDESLAEGDRLAAEKMAQQIHELERSARQEEVEVLRHHAEDLEREIRRLKRELDQPDTVR